MSALAEDPDLATDLHGHSRFSDARVTPEEYVAARAALRLIALSDHDVMAGVRRAAAATQALGGPLLLPALEATSFLAFGQSQAEQFHVLAYYPAATLTATGAAALEERALYRRGLLVQARWRAFVLTWLDEQAADARAALDPAGELARLAAAEFPGLITLVERILSRCRDVYAPFIRHHVRFWTEDRELFGWTPEELIDAIRADGAIDVVAHPARYRDKERLAQVLLGASGVEAYTSRHRPEWAERFRAFAEAHGKLWTASTDDHQVKPYQPPPARTPRATAERLYGASLPAG